jgi:hypothetical protein
MPLCQHTTYQSFSDSLISTLETSISPPRFNTYLREAGFKRDRAVRLYLRNVMLGQSFHFPLHVLEVVLRNAIARVFVARFGEKWWRTSIAKTFLDQWAIEQLEKARDRIQKRKPQCTSDEIIATLSFGFWTAALAPKYKEKLWNHHLAIAFPHAPNGTTCDILYAKANNALDLRNRIFHHESLVGVNVLGKHSEIMQLLKWICPETQSWVKSHCSTPMLTRAKP